MLDRQVCAPFIFLGDKLLKDGGIMGIIIPRGILSGVSWTIVRQKLMKSYSVKYIISNYDAGGEGRDIEPWNWSEDIHIGEVMLIVKKINKKNKNNETILVNFWKKPENEYKAILFSLQIKPSKLNNYVKDGVYEEFYDGGEAVGAYYKIPQNCLGDNWLAPVLFANPNLNSIVLILNEYLMINGRYIKDIVKHKPAKARNKKTSKTIYLAGMDRKEVEDYFKKDDAKTPYNYIDGVSGINCLYPVSSIINASLKNSKGKEAFALYSSNLCMAERIWTNSSKLLSIYTEDIKVITTEYWEIILNDTYVQYDIAVLLWLNSTFGLMYYLSNCINNGGVAFNMKKNNLLLVKIPEFIFNIDLKKIKQLYNEIRLEPFENFDKQFIQASNKEGVRFKIDNFFIDLYSDNIKKENMQEIYKMLSEEPIFKKRSSNKS